MTEFQSHEPEFDYLKSLEIEEKINKVRWCRSSNNTRMLLSTNDKTVKLWKVRLLLLVLACLAFSMGPKLMQTAFGSPVSQVYEKKVSCLANFNLEGRNAGPGGPKVNALNSNPKVAALKLPKVCIGCFCRFQCILVEGNNFNHV